MFAHILLLYIHKKPAFAYGKSPRVNLLRAQSPGSAGLKRTGLEIGFRSLDDYRPRSVQMQVKSGFILVSLQKSRGSERIAQVILSLLHDAQKGQMAYMGPRHLAGLSN